MGDPRGFLKSARKISAYRAIPERIQDYKDVVIFRPEKLSQEQASRCMDCSTSFCHWGCPLGNYIPEWNDALYRGKWKKALNLLEATNDFPEITGRLCPALCEHACVLGLNDDAVTIRENELSVIEAGFKNGLIGPMQIRNRTGKKVAIVGSGPAGLSAAVQLNRAGHTVTVFERDAEPGGILRYGIPDFKLEKNIIDRRLQIWRKEGVIFKTNTEVGKDYPACELLKDFDAICLAGGARKPRDLNIEGRNLQGIVFAMDYLTQSNRRVAGEKISKEKYLDAKNKKVVVIGGGDTGADCVGTAHRQGAKSVVQIEVMPCPSVCRTEKFPWPKYPLLLKNTSSHEEGADRRWAVLTKSFKGDNNSVRKLVCVRLEFKEEKGVACPTMCEIPNSAFDIEADLVILAVGFLHPEHSGLLNDLNILYDNRGNVKTDDAYQTSVKKVFAAGDMRRGQSLVVWALAEGRRAARHIDEFLMGSSRIAIL